MCVQIYKSLAHSKHGLYAFYGFCYRKPVNGHYIRRHTRSSWSHFFVKLPNFFWHESILKLISIQNFSPIGCWVLMQLLYLCKTETLERSTQSSPTHRVVEPKYRVVKSKYLPINKWATLLHILKYRKLISSQWNLIRFLHKKSNYYLPYDSISYQCMIFKPTHYSISKLW